MNTDTSKKTFLLVEGALMIAMAFVLSYIKLMICRWAEALHWK